MSASTAGAGDADRRAAHALTGPRGPRPSRAGGLAAVAAPAVAAALAAVVVNAAAALLSGAAPAPSALLLAAAAALAVLAAARACGLGRAAAAVAAVLAAASPVAVAAAAVPGASAAALVLVPALAAAAQRLLPRSGTAPAVLALGPLAAAAPGLGGWGAGSAAWHPGTAALRTAAQLDPVLPVAAVVAAAVLLAAGGSVRTRLLGASALAAAVLVVLLGLPAAALAPALAVGSAALAGGAARLVTVVARPSGRAAHEPHGHHRAEAAHRGRHGARAAAVTAALAVVGVLLLAPTWSRGLARAAASGDPGAAAARWLAGREVATGGVAVDPALYEEVATSSALASRVVPAGSAQAGDAAPHWLVAGPDLRQAATPGTWAAQALVASRAVAVFGAGADRVEVREMDERVSSASASPSASGSASPSAGPTTSGSGSPPAGPTSSASPSSASSTPPGTGPTQEPSPSAGGTGGQTGASPGVTEGPPPATATPASEASVRQLLENSQLDFSPRAREALQAHPVDLRLAALLVQLAATSPVSVSDVPAPDGTAAAGAEPLRTVVIDGIGGQAVGADLDALLVLERQLSAQDRAYRAEAVREQDGTTPVLRLTLPPAAAS